jgi:hypothetical protein
MDARLEEQKQAFLKAHAGDYFYCEREYCTMSKQQCLEYQRQAAAGKLLVVTNLGIAISYDASDRIHCMDCPQGRKIARECKKREDKGHEKSIKKEANAGQ